MLYEILNLILGTVAGLFGSALLLRAYVQRLRVDPYHPLVQFVMHLTNPVVLPLRRVIPGWGRIDWASLVAAWLVALGMWLILFLLHPVLSLSYFWAVLWHSVFTVLDWTLYLVLLLTVLYAMIGWINPYSPHVNLLGDLTRPFLQPLRRIVPLVGRLDLSPVVLFLLVQIAFIVLQHLQRALV